MKFIMVPKTYDTAVNFLYKVFFAFLRCKNDFTKALSACEWVSAGFCFGFFLRFIDVFIFNYVHAGAK